jgi:ribose/xylose/arabinose/galactoside ABC-type transport system permease subunit
MRRFFGGRLGSYLLPLGLLVATWIIITVTTPTFRGEASFFSVLEGFPLVGLVALGLAGTIIAGELDLSVGSMAAFAGVIAVETASSTGLIGALAIAILIGTTIGAAQGWVIGRVGINSLVLTVGTLILLSGAAWLAAGNRPRQLTDFTVSDPLIVRHGIFSVSSITALVVFLLMGLFLAYTRYGREIYAIGGGREEARAAGVPALRPMMVCFAASGGCAALAGALASLKGGSAAPQNFDDVLLSGVAAVLIGGVSLYGGRGTVLHVALGVAVLSAVTAALAARGSDASVTQLVTGALLIIVVAAEFVATRLTRRARLRRELVRSTSPRPFPTA